MKKRMFGGLGEAQPLPAYFDDLVVFPRLLQDAQVAAVNQRFGVGGKVLQTILIKRLGGIELALPVGQDGQQVHGIEFQVLTPIELLVADIDQVLGQVAVVAQGGNDGVGLG